MPRIGAIVAVFGLLNPPAPLDRVHVGARLQRRLRSARYMIRPGEGEAGLELGRIEGRLVGRIGIAAFVAGLSALALAGCSSGDEAAAEGRATLEVIDRAIDVERDESGYEQGESGMGLAVGDSVRADATGFGEVQFFDGSWMRIEASAIVAIEELAATDDGHSVRTSITGGRSWQRVEELTDSGDRFEVETPVGTAAVRGTGFSIDCTLGEETCEFMVPEGRVQVTVSADTKVVVEAGERLLVEKGEDPGEPDRMVPDEMYNDPWIAKNLELDAEAIDLSESEESSAGEPSDENLAAATLAKTWLVDVLVTDSTDDRYPVDSTDEVRWGISVDCGSGDCGTARRIADEDGDPSLLDASGRVIDERIVATGPGEYRIEVSWIEPCTLDGEIVAESGYRTTKVAEYTTVDAEFREGFWVATELDGGVRTSTALTADGEAADCVLAANEVGFETEVTAIADPESDGGPR